MATELVFDDYQYEGELPEVLGEGDVYSVRMIQGAGLTKDVPLFMRNHLLKQDKKIVKWLSNKNFSPGKNTPKLIRDKLYVAGPPGCGKTAFATLVAHRYAAGKIAIEPNKTPTKKRVLMILFRENASCQVLIIEGQKAQKLRMKLNVKNIQPVVECLLQQAQDDLSFFDMCICDGVRQSIKECRTLIQVINGYTGEDEVVKRTIYTTSLQFKLRGGDSTMGSNRDHEQLKFDSFTLEDYLGAVGNMTFLERLLATQPKMLEDIRHMKEFGKPLEKKETSDEDSDNEQEEDTTDNADLDAAVKGFLADGANVDAAREYIEHNFFYAGGSARFMFENTTYDLKGQLRDLFDELATEEWSAFANNALSPKASTTVNSLMQQFHGCTSPVSRRVLFEAYDKVEGRLVGALQAAADRSHNPALAGWAFEIKQLHSIKTVLQNNSRGSAPPKVLKAAEGLCFRPVKKGEVSFDGYELINHEAVDLRSGAIIWCMKWNQGCFDVAFFKNNTLITLQFTVSSSHSLKVQYIKELKDAIERVPGVTVSSCRHVGIVGGDDVTSKLKDFKFDNPEGAGRSSRHLAHDFTVKTYKASRLFEKEGQEEDCLHAAHLDDIEVFTNKRALDTDSSS